MGIVDIKCVFEKRNGYETNETTNYRQLQGGSPKGNRYGDCFFDGDGALSVADTGR